MSMKLSTRILNAALALAGNGRFGNALEAMFNRYEAAQPGGAGRPWLPGFVRDAKYDANSFSRWEMCRKIRYFQQNMWLIRKLREVYVKYVVGPNGLQIIPASSDSDFNKRALEKYLEWGRSPFLDSNLCIGEGHKLMAGELQIDGEVFALKSRFKSAGRQSTPAIQLIESHRCSSPFGEFAPSGTNFLSTNVDGVEIDANGTPTGYHLRTGKDALESDLYSKEDVIHIYNPDRIGMYRGITPYYATLSCLQDLYQLEEMEMQKAKANAERAWILFNKTGEMDASKLRQMGYGSGAGTSPSPGLADDDLKKRMQQFRTVYGSRGISLRSDEEMKIEENPNPSAATQWYWRYKISQICAAAGIPMILVLPESIQGTVARAIMDDANIFFRGQFHLIGAGAKQMYWHWLDWAVYNDKNLVDPPADYRKCHVLPPRAVNVDVGRNSKAMLAELQAGTTSYDAIAANEGLTPEILFQSKGNSVVLAHQIAQQLSASSGFDIKPADIMGNLAEIIQKLGQSRGQESEPEQEQATSTV